MSSKVKAQAKRKHGAVKRHPRLVVIQAEATYWSDEGSYDQDVYDGYGGYAGKSSDVPPE